MSSLATAAASSGAGLGNLLIFALPILLIVFMFMSQRRRQRAVQDLQSKLAVGDEVSTTSGLLGRVSAIDDTVVTLEVSPGVMVRFDRRAIGGPAPTATGPTATTEPGTATTTEPGGPAQGEGTTGNATGGPATPGEQD